MGYFGCVQLAYRILFGILSDMVEGVVYGWMDDGLSWRRVNWAVYDCSGSIGWSR